MTTQPLPRDRDILKRLYDATSDQLKRWDEARALFHAAFRQIADRLHDGMSSDEKWLLVKRIIPESAPLIHLSSEIEPFIPNMAANRISILSLTTDDFWIEVTYLDDPKLQENAKEVDDNLASLISLAKSLRDQILEAMVRWSKKRPPQEWERVFKFLGEDVVWKTIRRQGIRMRPGSTTRLVSFDIDQLPSGYDDTLNV